MKLAELEAQFRADIRDVACPAAVRPAQVRAWFNEAEAEAALRARLLTDDATPAVTQIAVTAGTPGYRLHAAVNAVSWAQFNPAASVDDPDAVGTPTVLRITSRLELSRTRPHWRSVREPVRDVFIEQRAIRFGCIPDADGTLLLEVYRGPLAPMDIEDDDAEPEIAGQHHLALVQWALYRAYARPNIDTYDARASAAALAEFERIFGLRPDAQLGQDDEDVPHVNHTFLP
jgi:hypothetical protein